jgi:hypothetical protein
MNDMTIRYSNLVQYHVHVVASPAVLIS